MNPVIFNDMKEIFDTGLVDWRRLYGKTVLVSGAYGMLASYMVFMLIFLNETQPDADIRILALGRSRKKMADRFGDYASRGYFTAVEQDVCASSSGIPRADFIIHAAGHSSPRLYGTHPVDVILPNTTGTLGLLEKARADQAEGFLFFSSGAAQGLLDDRDSIAEQDMGYLDPMDVSSCYGESKRLGETLCKGYCRQYGVPAKVVRPGHTYGPTLDLNDSRSFAAFVSDAVHGRDIAMKSAGDVMRVFCYIGDATLACFKVLLDAPAGEAYLVTDPDNVLAIRDLAALVASLSRRPGTRVVRMHREAGDTHVEILPMTRHPRISVAKLQALGWKSRVSLEEGFRRTIQSFLTGSAA
ncbi:MAG TPA: NAD-dependent epimerase/dehydratase family protein [Steroidobacteraceae bacterium]|nr:NAD-dependent epimerase/dehydratase family protein [Steroidobacteraceae bacterium]